jgi:hypothetical protein
MAASLTSMGVNTFEENNTAHYHWKRDRDEMRHRKGLWNGD